MKPTTYVITFLAIFFLTGSVALAAAPHAGHGSSSNATEKEVHQAMVDGNHLTYKLIDMHARMATLKSKAGIDLSKVKSHHLMLFIHGADGKLVADGKVGFLVTGPDGKTQKVMTMAMSGGYGGDVDMPQKGIYQVKVKAVAGGATLRDSFTIEQK